MTPEDVKRLANIRAVYATAQPSYTDIDFLLRIIDELFEHEAQSTEIFKMVAAALSEATGKSRENFMPMSFNDAIRNLANQRDKAAALAASNQEACTKWANRAGNLGGRLHRVGEALRAIDSFGNSRENIAERLKGALDEIEPGGMPG